MTDSQTTSTTGTSEGTASSHSELFGLPGQKRASTTAGAGAGSGIIGTSGHAGAANKSVELDPGSEVQNTGGVAGVAEGGKSSTVTGSGGETLTPSQGSGDVRPAGQEKGIIDKSYHSPKIDKKIDSPYSVPILSLRVASFKQYSTRLPHWLFDYLLRTRGAQSVTLSPPVFDRGDSPITALSRFNHSFDNDDTENEDKIYIAPPPHSPRSAASSSSPPSPRPPPFSSLYFPSEAELDRIRATVTETHCDSLLASAPAPSFEEALAEDEPGSKAERETKAALPQDTKAQSSSGKAVDDGEPPPPYTEGSSPLDSFSYLMAAAGGAASIITQVQQTGPPINTLGAGEAAADEHITLDLRGTHFTLSRDELLTLPEFVLLSLFPNGLLPDGHMNSFHEGDVYPVDYDPASLQYMLNFFRDVAQSIPSTSPSPTTPPEHDPISIEPLQGSTKDMLQDRAGIIVLREDLDFYVIPPRPDIEQPEMTEIKRAAGKSLLKQDGIFSGLKRSEEAGTTEQHLIEMLTAGSDGDADTYSGFNHDDAWGHRAGEPNKAVICSLALARLRTDIKGDLAGSNAVGMAQKLLLFWRKPARRCWWEGVELTDVDGVEGKLKVWIRRVWTLEMSVIGLR
ncbi:general stress response protein Whi2 [Fonsecaea pedrosoi]|nr:general stress response protein Whi2 [Fonsecaea pedrosoi]